ncbi:hypothetical protein Q0590_13575 [Rhodocytophaga aerolata]|uniref:Uncharacterized protein n=1 Tax=Rhodocytophaga aerolata TaxID=455078 RepID=A0ABT8R7I0_9BACT|nr:hypothetical protein [Rhodocytophaga aerolata]MDO1447294.1 hypothetical protein [Rhodocytophaga aerolata]
MSYLVRVEDRDGRIKSYFKFHDISRAKYVYTSISEQCAQRGEVVKLLDEDFQVLQVNTQPLTRSHRAAS